MNLQVEASSGWRSGFLPNKESKGGKIITLGKKGLKGLHSLSCPNSQPGLWEQQKHPVHIC